MTPQEIQDEMFPLIDKLPTLPLWKRAVVKVGSWVMLPFALPGAIAYLLLHSSLSQSRFSFFRKKANPRCEDGYAILFLWFLLWIYTQEKKKANKEKAANSGPSLWATYLLHLFL